MNYKLLISALVSVLLVLVLHLLAIALFLYWKYWWYDNIIHLLGGVSISLIVIYFSERFLFLKDALLFKFAVLGFVGALVASLFWEIFEYKIGITFVANGYVLDTFADFFMGFIGAWFGAVYAYSVRLKNG